MTHLPKLLAASEAFQRLLSKVDAEGETLSLDWREELRGL